MLDTVVGARADLWASSTDLIEILQCVLEMPCETAMAKFSARMSHDAAYATSVDTCVANQKGLTAVKACGSLLSAMSKLVESLPESAAVNWSTIDTTIVDHFSHQGGEELQNFGTAWNALKLFTNVHGVEGFGRFLDLIGDRFKTLYRDLSERVVPRLFMAKDTTINDFNNSVITQMPVFTEITLF